MIKKRIEADAIVEAWCRNEIQTCPVICEQTGDGSTKINECDPVCVVPRCFTSMYTS